ncbi:MAG: hypothetical protein Tsb0013_00050 [Phycisphaerales bacterium]
MPPQRDDKSSHSPSFATEFDTISAKSQWLYWFTVMLAVCACLVVAYFAGAIDIGLYIAMFGLAILMMFKGFRDVRFFDRETRLASQQVALLERVHNFEDFLRQSKPSMFRSHIANLYEIAFTHPDVSQDTLIELLHSRLMARNRTVELFASVLVTLGLIGTIIGLMLMMNNLQEQVLAGTDGGTSELISKLFGPGGALVGLSTAFMTTLIGATLGGVVLRVLTSVVASNITRYTAHVAELTEVFVLPSMRRSAAHAANARQSTEGQQSASMSREA